MTAITRHLRCIVVEDEYPAMRLLQNFIGRIPDLILVNSFKNAVAVPQFLMENTIDILFLDIQMPFLSGTDLLRQIDNKPATIFTTANPQYAVEAFNLDVVDYLVKPFSFERFEKAVAKAIDYHTFKAILTETTMSNTPQYLSIKSDYKTIKIFFDEILYIEGLSEYVRIITSQKSFVTLIAMKDLEEQLAQRGFTRIHKSFIINDSKVRSVSNKQIIMQNGIEIPVGRVYKGNISKFIKIR